MRIDVKSIRYGAFILTVGNICSQLLGFLYRILLSRMLGSEGMGLFQLIFPFYSLALTVTVSGIGVAVSKLTAEYMALGNFSAIRLLIKRAVTIFIFAFSILSLFVLVFSKGISSVFLGDERTLLIVRCCGHSLPGSIYTAFLYGSKFNPPASRFIGTDSGMSAVLLLLRLFLPQPDELVLIIIAGDVDCEIFSATLLSRLQAQVQKNP